WFLIAVQVIFLALEQLRKTSDSETPNSKLQTPGKLQIPSSKGDLGEFVWPVLVPMFCIGSTLIFLFGLCGFLDGFHLHSLSQPQQLLLIAALLITARAHVSVLFLLVALLLSYLTLHHGSLASLIDPDEVLKLLAEPWRLSSLALAMVLV